MARILVVDDDVRVLKSIARMLSRDHVVSAVESAAEALRLIGAGDTFDVVLTDLQMPRMTGEDFFVELRRTSPTQAERVVFFSGSLASHSAFLAMVPNLRLAKPCSVAELQAAIATVLGRGTPT